MCYDISPSGSTPVIEEQGNEASVGTGSSKPDRKTLSGFLLGHADGIFIFSFFFHVLALTHYISSLLPQRADQQASDADGPSVRVSEGPGGGEEEPPGAAILALPAQPGGGRAGAVDRSEGGGRQLAGTGSRLRACHRKWVDMWRLRMR